MIGDAYGKLASLMEEMKCWGAAFGFASTRAGACKLLESQEFGLVLSRLRLPDASAIELITLVEGRRTDLFSYMPAGDGLRWLHLVHSGKECVGSDTMRTPDFLRIIEKLLKGKPGTALSHATAGSR